LKLRVNPLAVILFFCLILTVVSASAQETIYSNGPINGTTNAWNISDGFAVSNSFILNPPPMPPCCRVPAEVEFGAWLFPGDTLLSVEVAITSSEFGGTTYFDQTLSVSQSMCLNNQFGMSVCTETATFSGGPVLASGTYWLTLENATTAEDNPVYWDENSGPSSASENSVGTIPSESFTILGFARSGGTTPEPGSILLFGSGVLTCVGLWRRRLHR
jgi:PEP-CTERM motif